MEQGQFVGLDMMMESSQRWRQQPFLAMEDNEVVDNMAEYFRNGNLVSLVRRYKSLRDRLLDPPSSKVFGLAALGPSGSVKGGLLMGLERLLEHDEYFHERLARLGLKLKIENIPFAQVAMAAKLPEVGIIPTDLEHGEYSKDHYKAISELQWKLANQSIASLPEGTVKIVAVEGSSPTAYPANRKTPWEVAGGPDRGCSSVYRLVGDPRLLGSDNVMMFLNQRDSSIKDDAEHSRQSFNLQNEKDLLNMFGKMHFLITRDGQEVDVRYLPLSEIVQIAYVLKTASAPPAAIERSDKELEQVLENLFKAKKIYGPELSAYYSLIKRNLNLAPGTIAEVRGMWAGDQMTYSLDYLIKNSLVAQTHPQILEPPKEWRDRALKISGF